MESVLVELYETLAQLRYPEIAKIDQKDLATTILAGQNRITLLTWLLSRASPTLSTHLEKFQESSLKDEVVKCYLQMGISIDENTLLGNCSIKQQISTLKSLLLFAKSLANNETVPIDDTAIYEVLDKYINQTVNIIPPTCNVSMKLTDSEAKKYLEGIKEKMTEVICLKPVCEVPETKPLAVKEKIESGNKTEMETEQLMPLDSVVEAFSLAFESAELWRNPNLSDPPSSNVVNIDETIENLYKGLNSVAQVFESKKAILGIKLPKCLEKCETPLSLLIENNVIFSEEIRNLYDQYNLGK